MTQTQKPFALAALCALSLSACGPVRVLELDESQARVEKPSDCKIEPFFGQAPERPHEVFGKLRYQVQASSSFGVSHSSGSRVEAMKALNAKACQLGADALLMGEENKDKTMIEAALLDFTDD